MSTFREKRCLISVTMTESVSKVELRSGLLYLATVSINVSTFREVRWVI